MDELKLIIANEKGISCHYYPECMEEPLIISVFHSQIPIFIFARNEDDIEDFIGVMETGIIWCRDFRYSKYGKNGIRLKVFI